MSPLDLLPIIDFGDIAMALFVVVLLWAYSPDT